MSLKVYKKDGGRFPWPIEDIQITKEQAFTGKPKIKREGVTLPMTEEHQKEWLKCRRDPVYFLKTYGRVVHIDHGLVPLKLYKYQEKMIRNFQNNRFSITLTCRQAGKTTGVVGFLAWYAIFHSEKDCHVLANKEKQAMEIMKRLRRLIEELPYFLQAGAVAFNQGNIIFENGSSVTGHASSSDSIRGLSAALLYIDEMAFLAQDEEFFESTFPTVSSGDTSKILITSTPKGARGVFYKLWKGAILPVDSPHYNEFVPLKVLWNEVPGRDENWRDKTIAKIGRTKFSQEHECEFLGSSGTLIPNSVLSGLQFKNPITELEDGNYRILYEPDPSHVYIAIADSAEGLGDDHDYSVCTVVDITTNPYTVVAKYRSNEISPLMFPYVIERMCQHYNNAWALVESNNDVGGQVSYILFYEIEYENCILTSNDKKGKGLKIGGSGAKPGVKTTSRVKNQGAINLRTLLENNLLSVEDDEIIEEMGTFIQKGNSFEADEGTHDDCVMTLVLFSWMIKDPWFLELASSDPQTALKKIQAERVNEEMSIFFSSASLDREDEEEAERLANRSLDDFFMDDSAPQFYDPWSQGFNNNGGF